MGPDEEDGGVGIPTQDSEALTPSTDEKFPESPLKIGSYM